MKPGDLVTILGRKRKLMHSIPTIQGGWVIDKPVEGFKHWNQDAMKHWRPLSKG